MTPGWWERDVFDGARDEGELRVHAGLILRAGIVAANPEAAVIRALSGFTPELEGRVVLIAAGKAAVGMARGAVHALGDRVEEGLVVGPRGMGTESIPPGLHFVGGGHPRPDASSLRAGSAILDIARTIQPGDTVICLLSGGASAMAVRPIDGVSIEELAEVTDLLLRAGAPIEETNVVRRHLDTLKGGRLALALAPARVIGLLISDVPGDAPEVIASGPLVPDPSTWAHVGDVLAGGSILAELPTSIRDALTDGIAGRLPETPKPGDSGFAHVDVRVIASASLALDAAAAEARRLGYNARLNTQAMTGEAREVGRVLAATLTKERSRVALLCAGETTVTVRGLGRGGRNQEVALGGVHELAGMSGCLLCAMGTDGIDGPTDAAGAVITGNTLERARTAGLDPDAALAANDAYPFFAALDDLIMSGPTGTNVMDLVVALGSTP